MTTDRAAPRLQLTGITKRYAGVAACDGVALTVQPGEIHAVLGENGAGKSTLMQIVYGLVAPDAGQIYLDGQPVRIGSPRQARRLGLALVAQQPSLFESMSVAENVWLALEQAPPLAEVARRIAQTAAACGLDVQPARPLHTLDLSGRQQVTIVGALLARPRLLILDEPAWALAPPAAERLFAALRQLAAEGCGILYISHQLDEVRALCSACTVLRAGRVVGVCDPREQSSAELARLMLGAEPPALAMPSPRRASAPRPVVLQVERLNLPRATPLGVDLREVSLQVRAGELVGIAGLPGNGQRELLAALAGEDRRAPAACISIAGQAVGAWPPQRRRALGLHYAPAERLGRGAVAGLSLAHNLLLTRRASAPLGWLRPAALRGQARSIIGKYGVQAAGPDAGAGSLSGGNLQKYIIGRELGAQPKLLIAVRPTWGVDVGAAVQIRAALLTLRNAGGAVLVVSDELDELRALCDRIHVMAGGRLAGADSTLPMPNTELAHAAA